MKSIYGDPVAPGGGQIRSPVSKDSSNYLIRLKMILVQLNATKEKKVAVDRMNLLLEEVKTTYPAVFG